MASFNLTAEDSSPLITYSPADAWIETGNDPAPYSAESYHASSSNGASASITFTGTGIWLYGATDAKYGSYNIAIDGATVVDGSSANSAEPAFQQLLGGTGGLAMGEHVATFTNTGDNTGLDLDSVVIESQVGTAGSSMKKAVVDDNDASVVYGPSINDWQVNNDASYFDNTLHFSQTGGAIASHTFQGRAIAVFGTVSPDHGTIDVEVDGKAKSVDASKPSKFLRKQTLLYYASNLGAGEHTIKLTGNAAQAGQQNTEKFMDVDWFEVYSDNASSEGGGPTQGKEVAPQATSTSAASSASAGAKDTTAAVGAASHSNHKAVIIGSAIGGVIFLLALLAAVFFFLWRKKRAANAHRQSLPAERALTPDLPMQGGGGSPVDAEKGHFRGEKAAPPPTTPSSGAAAASPAAGRTVHFAPVPPPEPLWHARKPSVVSMSESFSSSAPLLASPGTTMAQLAPPVAAYGGRPIPPRFATVHSRSESIASIVPSLDFAPPVVPAPSSRSASPARPSRPPSLDLPPGGAGPHAPARPARPYDPHLSVLNGPYGKRGNGQAPVRPSRPSSPQLSDVDVPVPGEGRGRQARRDRESVGIVSMYTASYAR